MRDERRFKRGGGTSQAGRGRCRARAKHNGERCGNAAVEGKDVCWIHGGRTPVTNGRYSKYLGRSLAQAVEAADPGSSLHEELALQRTLLGRAVQLLEEFAEHPGLELEALGRVQRMVAECRATAAEIARAQERTAIQPEQVEFVLAGLLRVLQRRLTADQLREVADELRDIRWPAGVEIRTVDCGSVCDAENGADGDGGEGDGDGPGERQERHALAAQHGQAADGHQLPGG